MKYEIEELPKPVYCIYIVSTVNRKYICTMYTKPIQESSAFNCKSFVIVNYLMNI